MRIGSNIPDLQGISAQRTEQTPSSSKPAVTFTEQNDSFPEDTVSVSTLTAKALQMPEVRQDKVDSLRQSVASGEYELDPGLIAGAMLNEA